MLTLFVGLVPAAACATAAPVAAPTVPGADSGLPVRALSGLPAQAGDTVRLVQRGGPYPYGRDGIEFGNREGSLPDEARGYYREYTVPTPGFDDRGARRIVTGSRGEYYYTGDHYGSFVVVDVSR
ncbi:ribonuclease domain-containing protein [Actinomycetospora atypica]|uniref:Ribonuclease domain-containing protein n=1 Tax=Actinomycetospora atypica TaxID=1290095 RepID=A0ABV9YMF6_9PSEU